MIGITSKVIKFIVGDQNCHGVTITILKKGSNHTGLDDKLSALVSTKLII